jgi:TRAP-type C4-dicarboxylate transport system substrate-binding protein
MRTAISWLTAALLAATVAPAAAQQIPLRVAGNFSQNTKHVDGIERPFFTGLAAATGIGVAVNYNPMDVLGVQAADALRLLRSGAFDVMSVQIGMASRDDPFFEGIDLIGVSTDMPTLKKAVDSYRDAFDKRLQSRFNAKAMTLWPFGPQVFYCNADIKSLADFKGLKVRTFTPSMSALLEHLGATPVTLQFSEVYPALQRGVASCGLTSPTSGNQGKWPEVTTHQLPLSVSGSVQGHFMNLDTWKKFSPDQQAKIEAAFRKMEDQMWDLAIGANQDALDCNTGAESCKDHTKFRMKLVQVSAEDEAKLKGAVTQVILPTWKATCNRVWAECSAVWNDTVGKTRGYAIP